MTNYNTDKDGWLVSDPDKPWEILRFVADAAERGDEVEGQWRCGGCAWDSSDVGGALEDYPFRDAQVRVRIKPRPLAPYWKPLVEAHLVPLGVWLLDEEHSTLSKTASSGTGKYWLHRRWTHWATNEDVLYGVRDE